MTSMGCGGVMGLAWAWWNGCSEPSLNNCGLDQKSDLLRHNSTRENVARERSGI
jgi:hypothetical protein